MGEQQRGALFAQNCFFAQIQLAEGQKNRGGHLLGRFTDRSIGEVILSVISLSVA